VPILFPVTLIRKKHFILHDIKFLFMYNLRLHTLNHQCLPVFLHHYRDITHTNSGFSEYSTLEDMQMKCELEIRKFTPPGIVSCSISRKLVSGESQREEMVGVLVGWHKAYFVLYPCTRKPFCPSAKCTWLSTKTSLGTRCVSYLTWPYGTGWKSKTSQSWK
jgi:hypothetical protein